MPIGNFKKLIDVQNNVILYVFAFKEITTKFGSQRVLLCSNEKELTEKTVLSTYWATSVINSYIDKFKTKWKRIDSDIYGSISGVSIFKFRKIGYKFNATRNKYADIEIIAGRSNLSEKGEKENVIKWLDISSKQCTKIDALITEEKIKQGDTITITGMRNFETMVLLSIESNNKSYHVIANSWLKEVLKEYKNKFKDDYGFEYLITNSILPYFNCVVGLEKRSVNKRNEHIFITGSGTKLPIEENCN
jgi:hypothetical protein